MTYSSIKEAPKVKEIYGAECKDVRINYVIVKTYFFFCPIYCICFNIVTAAQKLLRHSSY